MTLRRRLALLLLAAVLLPACEDDSPTLPDVLRSTIEVTVEPSPLLGVQNVLTGVVSVAYRVKITETNGLGGEVVFVSSAVFDPVTGVQVALNYFDSADLTVFVGTKRVEPLGELVVPQTLSYLLTDFARVATLTVNVQFKDDRGNLINQSVLVRIVE